MTRWVSYALFIGIGTLVVGGWHWYLWARLVRDPGWSPMVSRLLTVGVVVLAVSLPAAMVASRALPPSIAGPFAWVAFTWMGTGFVLLVMVGLVDVLWLATDGTWRVWDYFTQGSGHEALQDPARRQVIARSASVVAGSFAAAATVGGMRGALGEVAVEEVPVRLARLPNQLEGLTLVQLTDIHVGPTIGRRFIQGLVEKTNDLKPDAVVITGDLVDGSVDALLPAVAELRHLKSRWGTYFITGNHEYYSGVGSWLKALKDLDMTTLENERVVLGDAGASIDLAGIPDPTGNGYAGRGPDVTRAIEGRDPERELVLLAHQPRSIGEAVKSGAGLQLSGHTHGGQIFPFNILVGLAQPYMAGLYRHDEQTQIYVSRGTGFWGPPMRIGAPAEITKLVLTAG